MPKPATRPVSRKEVARFSPLSPFLCEGPPDKHPTRTRSIPGGAGWVKTGSRRSRSVCPTERGEIPSHRCNRLRQGKDTDATVCPAFLDISHVAPGQCGAIKHIPSAGRWPPAISRRATIRLLDVFPLVVADDVGRIGVPRGCLAVEGRLRPNRHHRLWITEASRVGRNALDAAVSKRGVDNAWMNLGKRRQEP
jgi:hypothetical protein